MEKMIYIYNLTFDRKKYVCNTCENDTFIVVGENVFGAEVECCQCDKIKFFAFSPHYFVRSKTIIIFDENDNLRQVWPHEKFIYLIGLSVRVGLSVIVLYFVSHFLVKQLNTKAFYAEKPHMDYRYGVYIDDPYLGLPPDSTGFVSNVIFDKYYDKYIWTDTSGLLWKIRVHVFRDKAERTIESRSQ